ncbi:esterase FrsA [Vibrio algicola]|uniref:Esterase FrsA n=1 Tax=Vibrio algicola TaxID=2662262 RepID=A0A5Q0TCI2_9VIBR|nr:esterase FrsA [Vibrio algicola]
MEEKSKNISESLFKKHHHASETSSLVQYLSESQTLLEATQERTQSAWYRTLRRVQWSWQGLDPIETESVLARIASSANHHQDSPWLDTIAGYRPGNWSYEWTQQGMSHQIKANGLKGEGASNQWYLASLCFSIASYPHLNTDTLSLQAQILVNKAYSEAMEHSQYITKKLSIPFENKKIEANLHLPHTERPLPVVIVCAGIDSLQTDMWRIFRDYLAEHEIAMLTIDMPGIGSNTNWKLTEDSCRLHRAVLHELRNIPWVDHFKVGLLGLRFGGNILTRMAFLEQEKVHACVSLGAPIHGLLSTPDKFAQMPKMHIDTLASRLGKKAIDIPSLAKQMSAWSLKSQGILSSRSTPVPILALGLEGDPVGSKEDNQSVARFSQGGKAMQLSSKSIHQGYEQALKIAVDWLKDALK